MSREDQIAHLRRAARYLSELPDAEAFRVQIDSYISNAALLEHRLDYTPPDLSTTLYAADNVEDFVSFVHLLGAVDDGA